MAQPKLTLAVEYYDRHLPLLDGSVAPKGINLQVIRVSVEAGRHERMLDGQEWTLTSFPCPLITSWPKTGVPI